MSAQPVSRQPSSGQPQGGQPLGGQPQSGEPPSKQPTRRRHDRRRERSIIVGFETALLAQDAKAARQAVIAVLKRLHIEGASLLGAHITPLPNGSVAAHALISLDSPKLTFDRLQTQVRLKSKAFAGIRYVEHNTAVTPNALPPYTPDPLRGQQWALSALGVDTPWKRPPPTPGQKTIVAIVDSGLRRPDGSIPEDFGSVEPLADCQPPPDTITVPPYGTFPLPGLFPDGVDEYGHGTFLAGTIAAKTDNGIGIASAIPDDWGVSLMPIKFFAPDQSPDAYSAAVAIIHAVSKGARVINASWHVALGDQAKFTLQDAIDIATQNKCLVVAAAGHDGIDNDEFPTYPANLEHVLAVAATDRSGFKASFSNYSPDMVELAAPGLHIVTTGAYFSGPARYPEYNGTSAAAAFVSSGAALIFALNPGWDADDVAHHLMDSGNKRAGLAQVCIDGNALDLGRAVYGPLHVTAPAAAAVLKAGQQTTIKWTNAYKSAKLDKVRIELSKNGGASWNTVLVASTPNNGQWKWTPVTSDKTTNGRIRLTPIDGNFPVLSEKFKVV